MSASIVFLAFSYDCLRYDLSVFRHRCDPPRSIFISFYAWH